MDSSIIFPAIVSVGFSIWAALTLYNYAARGTRKRVLFVSYLGFIVTFGCVVLISFDIENTLANRYRNFLYYAWRVFYWSLQLLSWVVYPFNMEKDRTGSWRKSLHRNAIWWGIYVVVGVVAVVYFFGLTSIGWSGMLAFAYAASNSWGLLLIIFFAGYGLVGVPQWLYLKSNPREYQEYLYVKAVGAEDSRLSAKYDLQDAYNESKKTLDLSHPDMLAVASYLSSTYGQSTETATSGAPVAVPQDSSLALRVALQTAKRSNSAWNMLVKESFVYEDIYGTTGAAASQVMKIQAHRLYSMSMKVAAVGTAILSALIMIGQATIFIDVWWLSLLAVVFRAGVWNNPSILANPIGSFFIEAMITIPPLWVFYCCFWSLTRLKLSTYYGLYPDHNTDTVSLMWAGQMLIRISFALVYNYLFVLRIPDHPSTEFESMQGSMNVVPLLGNTVTEYFPLLIVVVAILTLTKTYSKLVTMLGLNDLQFDVQTSPGDRVRLVEEGKKLIARERANFLAQKSAIHPATSVLGGSTNKFAILAQEVDL